MTPVAETAKAARTIASRLCASTVYSCKRATHKEATRARSPSTGRVFVSQRALQQDLQERGDAAIVATRSAPSGIVSAIVVRARGHAAVSNRAQPIAGIFEWSGRRE